MSKKEKLIAGQVIFECSDTGLTAAFNWAKEKALSFAHGDDERQDPAGLWYEAALPNREAFCMRDVAHQSTGAAVLGLQAHNKNMLLKFAENISESKDYCSYWEINRYNEPAPIDYRNDKDFWYNLPANFDVLMACYQQYLWTGDKDYIEHPVFQNFYRLSLNEYIERWALGEDKILERDRLINLKVPKVESNSFYFDRRGIPTYNEGGKGITLLGIDLTAAMIAGYLSYANILNIQNNKAEAKKYRDKAGKAKAFLNDFWWDADKRAFRSIYYEDKSFDYFWVGNNQAFTHYLLYFDALDDVEKIKRIMDDYTQNKDRLIVELKSYLPILFYSYGNPDIAHEFIKQLAGKESNPRRDYPENSFAIVGDITKGLMGIQTEASRLHIKTLAALGNDLTYAKMKHLPVFDGTIDLHHLSEKESVLKNNTSQTIIWQACFKGKYNTIKAGQKRLQKDKQTTDKLQRSQTCVTLQLAAGMEQMVSVE